MKSNKNQFGQGLIEYGLIIGLIGVALILALSASAISIENAYCGIIDNPGAEG